MTGKLASRVRGLGEAEFQAAYGTEERCRTAVEELRWPEGFACPVCGGRQGTRLSTRPKLQCTSCRHQASSTAGTIFASTKLPLIPAVGSPDGCPALGLTSGTGPSRVTEAGITVLDHEHRLREGARIERVAIAGVGEALILRQALTDDLLRLAPVDDSLPAGDSGRGE